MMMVIDLDMSLKYHQAMDTDKDKQVILQLHLVFNNLDVVEATTKGLEMIMRHGLVLI